MNRLRSAFVALGLLLAVSAAQAQETRVKADIPFNFVVGNQVLPAGQYIVTSQGMDNSSLLIRSDDRSAAVFSTSYSCSSVKPSGTTKLVFHNVAGRYFLAQVWEQGRSSGRQIPKSGAEVELAKNHQAPEEFILAATLTR